MKRPIWWQTVGSNFHSDGCTPKNFKFEDGSSFRDFAHALLDEWLDEFDEEKDWVESIDSIWDGPHIIFAPCSIHKHD